MTSRILTSLLLSLVFFATAAPAQSEIATPPEEFLQRARHPQGNNHWAWMSGKATHRRRDKPTVEAPLYVGIRFTPERTFAQVVVNSDEAYNVGQTYDSSPDSTSVMQVAGLGSKSVLADFGLRPQDLTMTFLFWNFSKELEPDSVRGLDCRCLLLEAPDKKETARVFISSKYYFPVKVEWVKAGDADGKAYRTGEFTSFRQDGNFWLAQNIVLYGPGWKTMIEFDEGKADYSTNGVPATLFKKFPKSE